MLKELKTYQTSTYFIVSETAQNKLFVPKKLGDNLGTVARKPYTFLGSDTKRSILSNAVISALIANLYHDKKRQKCNL